MGKSVNKVRAIKNLKHKGFVDHPEKNKADHIILAYRDKNGKLTDIHTKFSRGTNPNEINESLMGLMKGQLQLETISQVYDLLSCAMNLEAYNKILVESGVI